MLSLAEFTLKTPVPMTLAVHLDARGPKTGVNLPFVRLSVKRKERDVCIATHGRERITAKSEWVEETPCWALSANIACKKGSGFFRFQCNESMKFNSV